MLPIKEEDDNDDERSSLEKRQGIKSHEQSQRGIWMVKICHSNMD
jgi:hypothetical protein